MTEREKVKGNDRLPLRALAAASFDEFESGFQFLISDFILIILNRGFGVLGFWGFGEIGRASCRERV